MAEHRLGNLVALVAAGTLIPNAAGLPDEIPAFQPAEVAHRRALQILGLRIGLRVRSEMHGLGELRENGPFVPVNPRQAAPGTRQGSITGRLPSAASYPPVASRTINVNYPHSLSAIPEPHL